MSCKINRLASAQVTKQPPVTFNYETNGNIAVNDLGGYVYSATAPNAVEKIWCGTVNYAPTETLTYTPFNKTSTITEGNYELTYTYGPDQQRRKSVLTNTGTGNIEKTIIYTGSYEKITVGNNTYEVHYIAGGSGLTAINARYNNTDQMFYVYIDHLGSILKLTDVSGTVVYETNFDAWGRERNPNDWTYTANPNTPPEWLIRGFTGHEHLPEFGLINMNGRMYDPVIGRVLSPDNYVQDPFSTQDYNRYTYALNNPMYFTDHTGQQTKPPQSAWDPPWRNQHSGSSNHSDDMYNMTFIGGEYNAMSGVDLSWIFGKAFPDKHELFTASLGTMLEKAATRFFESRLPEVNLTGSGNFQAVAGSETNFTGITYEQQQENPDYRANLVTTKDPIRDIFSAIRTAKSENTLTNLYDVIVPNAYGGDSGRFDHRFPVQIDQRMLKEIKTT